MSRRWKLFWIIWLACLAPVLWSLLQEEGPQLARGKPLARIESAQGNVTVLSSGTTIWMKGDQGTNLYDADLVSTAANSRAVIAFEGGRKLQINPGSVVKLSFPSPMSNDHEVSVLKGRLVVKNEPDTVAAAKAGRLRDEDNRLILRTANEKLVADRGLAEKELAAAPAPLDNKTKSGALDALKNLNLNQPMGLAALPPPAEMCPPVPEPVKEEPKMELAAKEFISLPSFDPKLSPQLMPASGEFWTSEPLSSMADQALRLEVQTPSQLPRDLRDKWRGIVNISGPNGHIRVDGKPSEARKKLSLTLKDLKDAKVIDSYNTAAFAINTGYSLANAEAADKFEYSSPKTGVYNLRSLAEGEGVMIGIDRLRTSSDNSVPWLLVNPKSNKRIWIGVTDPEDRRRLFALARGNDGDVARSDWPGIPAEGAFIVRKDKIVGVVSAKNLSGADWDQIRKLFNAELIFSGSSQAYIRKGSFDPQTINDRKIYALNQGQFVEVDVSLLRTRPKSMQFVQSVSTYLFRDEAKILSIVR